MPRTSPGRNIRANPADILLDLYTQDEVGEERSAAAIASAADADVLVINPRFRGRRLSSLERRSSRIAGVADQRRALARLLYRRSGSGTGDENSHTEP